MTAEDETDPNNPEVFINPSYMTSHTCVFYTWTAKDVDKCLLYGSLDELLDALDYGPEGIKDTLAQRAVELKINDVSKRKAIQEKTGKNITSMIDLTEQYNAAVYLRLSKEDMDSAQKAESNSIVNQKQLILG